MKNRIKDKEFHIDSCPFCGTRRKGDERFCYACNLDFADLKETKIKDYTNAVKNKQKNESLEGKVVYAPFVPNDVSYGAFKMFAIFLGFFGVHNFYVGRFKKGIFHLIFSILTIGMICLDVFLAKKGVDIRFFSVWFALLPVGLWFADLFAIFRKKYKFPTLLKTPIDVASIYKTGEKKWKLLF